PVERPEGRPAGGTATRMGEDTGGRKGCEAPEGGGDAGAGEAGASFRPGPRGRTERATGPRATPRRGRAVGKSERDSRSDRPGGRPPRWPSRHGTGPGRGTSA